MINETKVGAVIKVADNIKKEDLEYIVETLTLKLCLIIFIIIILKIILSKLTNLCKRVYIVHNERVIRQNETATQTQSQTF